MPAGLPTDGTFHFATIELNWLPFFPWFPAQCEEYSSLVELAL